MKVGVLVGHSNAARGAEFDLTKTKAYETKNIHPCFMWKEMDGEDRYMSEYYFNMGIKHYIDNMRSDDKKQAKDIEYITRSKSARWKDHVKVLRELVYEKKVDVILELHFNAVDYKVERSEILIHSPYYGPPAQLFMEDGRDIAEILLQKMKDNFKGNANRAYSVKEVKQGDRGFRNLYFPTFMLKKPCILIEPFFNQEYEIISDILKDPEIYVSAIESALISYKETNDD